MGKVPIFIILISLLFSCTSMAIKSFEHELHPRYEISEEDKDTVILTGMNIKCIDTTSENYSFVFNNPMGRKSLLNIYIPSSTKSEISITETSISDIKSFDSHLVICTNHSNFEDLIQDETRAYDLLFLEPLYTKDHKGKKHYFRLYLYKSFTKYPSIDLYIKRENIDLEYINRIGSLRYTRYFLIPLAVAIDVVLIPVYAATAILIVPYYVVNGTFPTR